MTLDLTKRFLKDVSKIKNKDVRIAEQRNTVYKHKDDLAKHTGRI